MLTTHLLSYTLRMSSTRNPAPDHYDFSCVVGRSLQIALNGMQLNTLPLALFGIMKSERSNVLLCQMKTKVCF